MNNLFEKLLLPIPGLFVKAGIFSEMYLSFKIPQWKFLWYFTVEMLMLFGNMIIALLWIYIWRLFFIYYLIFLIFDSLVRYIYGNYLHKEHKGLQDKLKKFNELFMSFFSYSNLVMMKASLKHVMASGEDVEMHSQFRFFTKWLFMEMFCSKHDFFQILLYSSLVHYTDQLI